MSETPAAWTVAIAGQPNVGKSTLFNVLTGLNQYVSNWPGKTCEIKRGACQINGRTIELVDLPGAYSLTANSPEESLARDFLLKEKPDVVVALVDAVALERSLYLVAELVMLPVPLVVGVNRSDLAAQQGLIIEAHVLEAALDVPVVALSANHARGVQELLAAVERVVQNPGLERRSRPDIQAGHRQLLQEVEQQVAGGVSAPYPAAWVALKLLEGDAEITEMMRARLGQQWEAVQAPLKQHDDAFLAVASGRYEWIARLVRAAVARPKAGQVTITDRLDRLATHPFWGVLLLVGALGALFWLTYFAGAPLQAWLEKNVVQAGADWVRANWTFLPAWLIGLLAGGVITGVGTVLTLLPVLTIFFAGLGLLEDVGYMARAAFVMDRFMHIMGLHGKSFLPMFLGFGCNVPALMGTRIIEAPKARLTTLLVAPAVPCIARIAVLTFLAPIFFGSQAVWVTLGLLGLVVLVIALLGTAYHELLLGGEHTAFIMELPLYHAPDLQNIVKGIWQRLEDFLRGAGTVILLFSILLWALSTYPGGGIEQSYLAMAGRWLSPLGSLMGLSWQMMVALLTKLVRSENVISTLAVVYGAGASGAGFTELLQAQITPAAALSFMAVQLLFIPCAATVATVYQETRSWGWTLLNAGVLFAVALLIGIIIYQGAGLFGWGR